MESDGGVEDCKESNKRTGAQWGEWVNREIHKKEKRQREGIDAKKRRGDWDDYGRPKVIEFDKFSVAYEE